LKRVSILKCGPGIDEIRNVYGHASDWVAEIVSSYDNNININVINSYECIQPDNDDAWIITGSSSSCYEDKDWIVELEFQIKRGYEVNKPILGICFGHQIIAQSLGGKVIKNPMGWELGSNKINITDYGKKSEIFNSIPNNNDYYFSHQDTVLDLPRNAIELAYNEMGNQAYCIGEKIFGVQFHPEFSFDVMEAYIKRRISMGIFPKNPFISSSNSSYFVITNFLNILDN
tara:strand:+ start:319 stop:1008 length:690 start_codon:yes stop_codon:yes gene_type:complete